MRTRTIIVEHRQKPPVLMADIKDNNLFIIKCPKGLSALRYWLQSRKYNHFVETTDRNNKTILGLIWDFHHGTFPSPRRGERGAVLVLDDRLKKQAALIIINHLSAETDYSQNWKKAQRELWQYGRQ